MNDVVFLAFIFGVGMNVFIVTTIDGELNNIIENFFRELYIENMVKVSYLVNTLNIIFYMLLVLTIFSVATYIKYIFKTGLWKYWREKCLVCTVFRGLTGILRNIVETFDFTSRNNKLIFKVVIINFIVIVVIWV